MTHVTPRFRLDADPTGPILVVSGDWTVQTIGAVVDRLYAAMDHNPVSGVDVSDLGRLDTAGAFVIDRASGAPASEPVSVRGSHPSAAALLARMAAIRDGCESGSLREGTLLGVLERAGRGTVQVWKETLATLSFLGETLWTTARLLARPWRIRWTATVAVMEEAGLDALPIIAFLSYFVGMVVAFIGATTLRDFGATIFTVELVGYSVYREFGVVLTAIILAGRTNSSFAAQIGAMRMRQEIDAMATLGLSPMAVLVAPRVMAMVIMTPILTFVATLAGIAGGATVGWLVLDIGPTSFFARLQDYVPLSNFWVGMSKAPIYGLVVAMIGCRQGLLVGGSVQSLGRRTTTSVVQAIFAVIVLDALFAIFYMELGI